MKTPRVFTLEEANSLIPELEKRLLALLEKKESYTRRHDELFMHELLEHAENRGGLFPVAIGLEEEFRNLEKAIVNLENDIKEIHRMGCIVRNMEKGCVDFPGKWQGGVVFFCWRRGEKTVQFYHASQGDMSARHRLPDEAANLDK